MSVQCVGEPILRNEDERLLKGDALFTDDVQLPGLLHAAFLRSPYGHARILSIDVEAARQSAGVLGVYTAKDIGSLMNPAPLIVPPPPIEGLVFNQRTHTALASSKVRHVGEPIAMVVAESRYLAEDAIEKIHVDFEQLPVHLDIEDSLQAAESFVHDDLESNLAAHVVQRRGDYEKAKAEAHRVITRRFTYDRGIAAPIENRCVVADWNRMGKRLTVWDTTQAPIPIRNGLAGMLGLTENQVRVIAPHIGGAFGAKLMAFYSEEMLVPWASMQLERPVRWTEDRHENFYSTSHERGQVHEAEIAVDQEGHILGIKDVFIHDTGAYNNYGLTLPINSQCCLLGLYHIPSYYSEFRVAFTNKTLVAPYRGAGRQHGVFVIERLLDSVARELNIDRAEIRRRNLIPPDAFPYDHKIIYQDFAPLVYDSGNYEPVLRKAMDMIDYDTFIRDVQPRLRAEGRRVGIGIVTYAEGTGIGPYEGARVQVLGSGKVLVVTGVGTQGQGHYTSFAQLAAQQLGVDVTDVEVVTGDTDQFHWGTGTFASRGAVVAGNAVNAAATAVREKVIHLAADLLSVSVDEIDLVDGKAIHRADPEKSMTLGQLAAAANPTRGAVRPGTEPGLEATRYFGPERGTTAFGAHAAILEVEQGTYQIKVLEYVVVHDCGKVINPMIVEGQVHGGVAQGIGNAFLEQLVFDDQGRIKNANLRDFLLPTALEVPRMKCGHEETPSPLNPMGVKGTGEAGAIPVGPLFAQALDDAFSDVRLEILDIPLNSSTLWHSVQEQGENQVAIHEWT